MQFSKYFSLSFIWAIVLFSNPAIAQRYSSILDTGNPLIILNHEESPKLFIEQPPSTLLTSGQAVIPYRVEHMRILPVYGAAALDVSPRIGHLHVTVDNTPWHWADASGQPIILNHLAPGKHSVLIELAYPTHKVITGKKIEFVVPAWNNELVRKTDSGIIQNNQPLSASAPVHVLIAREVKGAAAVIPLPNEPSVQLVVDPPIAEQLALGRVFIQYRTENLRVQPVYGKAAIDISPRVGSIRIAVDGGKWQWTDTSGEPVIIVGLPPGNHNVLIEAVDPEGRALSNKSIGFVIPESGKPHSEH